MNKNRPKNLNLLTIRFPLPAIVSILHRASGVILFLCIPLLLWFLTDSLNSERQFEHIQNGFTHPLMKFFIWAFLAPLCFHLVAGIRHLLMDIHLGDNLQSGRMSARITLAVTLVLLALIGVWLW
jgi:succinate dehydrogenase / fumarate reductase cytochrome b subunit